MSISEKIKCKHHLGRLAHWSCETCGKYYCPECIHIMDKAGFSGLDTLYLCPACRKDAVWIGAENTIAPYWERAAAFFTYPLSINLLVFIIVLSVIDVFISPFYYGMLTVITFSVFLTYALNVLESTGQGSFKPPPLDFKSLFSDFGNTLVLIVVFFLLWFVIPVYLSMEADGDSVLVLYASIIAFISPALVMSFAATKDLTQMLNPYTFGRVIYKTGLSYSVLFFLVIMFLFTENFLLSHLMNLMPSWLYQFLRHVMSNYYILVMFHLMGYFLLQYSNEIGYTINFNTFYGRKEKKEPRESENDPQLKILNQAKKRMEKGEIDEAINFIGEWNESNKIKNPDLMETYYNLLILSDQTSRLLKFALIYLEHLVSQKDKKSISVFLECSEKGEQFLPPAKTLFVLADVMNGAGKVNESVQAYSLFVEAYPDSPHVPESYFKMAQIYNDRLFKTDKALDLLEFIQKQFPNSNVAPKAANYMKTI